MKDKSTSPPNSEKIRKPVDLNRFKELSDGDADSLLELLELYLSKTTEQVNELEQAVRTPDLSTVARIAHSLVGANAMVGIDVLVPLMRALEDQAEKNDLPRVRLTFANIQQEFQVIQEDLKEHVKILSNT